MPRATYRFQFHEGFPLAKARELVPYLQELGISHLYASPLFKARPHSMHGYDTCDFNQLNPELGTEADLEGLVDDLHARGMGLILDIVPNHMGVGGPENRWWWDVLARGPESPFANYFDIDWNSPDPRLRGKVLAPVLGDRYHYILEKGELHFEKKDNDGLLRYGENVFPINAPSLQTVKSSPEELNANPRALDALIEQQHYRLAWSGCGDSELNYRRFFNIASLPGLRMEDQKVFDTVFGLTRKWLERGWLDGLRVDHPDGLNDPEEFLTRLRAMAPKAWIIVEKILERGEFLPKSWPVDGTTGYDFLNCAGGLVIDPNGEKPLTDFYAEFTGSKASYPAMLREKKRLVLQTILASEVEHLTRILLRAAAGDWRHRDFTHAEISSAVIEWIACFPVYRTYAQPHGSGINETDAKRIEETDAPARAAKPGLPPELFDFLRDLLLLKQKGEVENEFAARFQQISAATMAKGAEDTAFYCFNRFVALNEVGGDPSRFGVSPQDFHQFCQRQQQDWSETMLASSTHDTKRSEDVRARLGLLTEIPQAWIEAVRRWSKMNQCHRKNNFPDRNAEYLYYQTLAGAWPLPEKRALEYMEKATHEAKEFTCWNKRDEAYDSALRRFIEATLNDPAFMADLESFVRPLLKPSCINSLSLTLLKMTAPGVPDFYQGSELLELTLVDPDNRRPVDFPLRQHLLAKAAKSSAEEAWDEWEFGLPKIWLIRQVLQLRARRPELFTGSYEPIPAGDHIVAFQRGKNMIVAVPRGTMHENDNPFPLPPGNWRNELTSEVCAGEANFSKFPVALLVREEKS